MVIAGGPSPFAWDDASSLQSIKGVHCEAVLEGVVVCHQLAILWGVI